MERSDHVDPDFKTFGVGETGYEVIRDGFLLRSLSDFLTFFLNKEERTIELRDKENRNGVSVRKKETVTVKQNLSLPTDLT